MGVTRILDLIVIALLATVVLLPRPDASVKPALSLDPERRARVAELQSLLIGHPENADASIELANIFLDGHRPDWALATVTAAAKFHPTDYRLQHVRAIAYADRFEGEPAYQAAARAVELCDQSGTLGGSQAPRDGVGRAEPVLPHAITPPPAGAPVCGDAARTRLALLSATLAEVAKVDMKNQPYLAKERILKSLHPTYIPKPKPPGAKTAPAAKAPAPAPGK
jgi:Flp pilus assembly protein TadD